MTAADIVDWASDTLGFTLSGRITGAEGVLLRRLPQCVLRIQDEEHAGYVQKTITTLEDVGLYVIGTGYDSIRSRVWPGEWYNIIPSLTGTHSLGSDITSENMHSKRGPIYVGPNELRDYQVRVTEYGASTAYPVIWTSYVNADRALVLELAPSEAVAAGLTILVDVHLSASIVFAKGDEIPLEDHYQQYLRLLVAAEGAAYAQGEMVAHSDYQGAQYYERRQNALMAQAETERARLVRTHNPIRQRAEINKFDTPWFPVTEN